MATNFNKSNNNAFGSSTETQKQKKSKNWLVIILIVVFFLLFIGLIISTIQYFKSDSKPAQPTQRIENNSYNGSSANSTGTSIIDGSISSDHIERGVENAKEFGQNVKNEITSGKSPQAIFISLLGMVFTGGSLYLLMFLKFFDKRNSYNVSNSFTFIANNRFFYISLFMGICFSFYIGSVSLFKNINMDLNMLIVHSSLIQKIYAVLAVILLIENYFKMGYSIPATLARTGIFLAIGITLLIAGYILGMILFYIIVIWLVFKIFFGMVAAENRRREEQARMDRWANSVVDALERRFNY